MTHCSEGLETAARIAHLLTIDKEAAALLLCHKIKNESTDTVAMIISGLIATTSQTICVCGYSDCPLNDNENTNK